MHDEGKWQLHCWPFGKSAYLSELFNILFALLTVGVRIGFVLLLKFGSAVGALDHRVRTTTVLADDEWDDQLDEEGVGIEQKLESHKMPMDRSGTGAEIGTSFSIDLQYQPTLHNC